MNGFTLLELLVAITITSLMASIMYIDLQFSVNAWKTGEARLNQMGQISTIQDFLRGRLEKAYPKWKVDDNNIGSVAYHGEPNFISFLTPMQVYLGKAPLSEVSIGVKETKPGQNDLEVMWKAKLPKENDVVQLEETVLLENIADVEFEYYGSEDVDKEPVWLKEWVNKTQPPFLISVSVHFLSGDDRVWPVLTVPHRIRIESACNFVDNINACADRILIRK